MGAARFRTMTTLWVLGLLGVSAGLPVVAHLLAGREVKAEAPVSAPDPDKDYARAVLADASGDTEMAVALFERAGETYLEPALRAAALSRLAEVMHQRGKDDDAGAAKKAALIYAKMVTDFPNSECAAGARVGLAECLALAGEWDQASRALDAAAKSVAGEASSGGLLLRIGRAKLLLGDCSGAAEVFAELLDKSPNCPQAAEAELLECHSRAKGGGFLPEDLRFLRLCPSHNRCTEGVASDASLRNEPATGDRSTPTSSGGSAAVTDAESRATRIASDASQAGRRPARRQR